MKPPRLEIVKSRAKKLYTPAGMSNRIQYHVRIRAANGQILMASEMYTRQRAAFNLVGALSRLAFEGRIVDETGDK